MDIDSALDKVGGYRRWHLAAFTLMGFSLFVPICFHGLIITFAGWQPNHHCHLEEGKLLNETIPIVDDVRGGKTFSKCQIYVNFSATAETNNVVECTKWDYISDGYYTIVEQWDLVCQYNVLSELSQSLYLVGYLISTLGLSFLIDKYGRIKIHIGSHILIAIIGVAIAFSHSFIMFVILRILLGMVIVINCNSGITYLTEIFDSKRRAFAGIGMEFPWIGCYLLLILGAYYIQQWKYLQIVISGSSIIFIVLYWIIPESPLWLVSIGKYDEAENVLRNMARWNGVKLDPDTKLLNSPSEENSIKETVKSTDSIVIGLPSKQYLVHNSLNGVNRSISDTEYNNSEKIQSLSAPNIAMLPEIDSSRENSSKSSTSQSQIENEPVPSMSILIKDRYLRRVVIISNLFWFGNCVLYYGLILSAPSLAGNRFVNFLIMGLVEIPAIFASWYTADRYGRRLSTSVYHILAGIPLAIVVFIPDITSSGTNMAPLIITLTMISKFAITASFAVIILYTKELFPTNLRGTGSGIGQILGNVGTLCSPFAMYLTKTSFYWAPNMFFGVVSVAVGLVTLLLPETAHEPLPQTVEDLHAMFKKKNIKARKSNSNDSAINSKLFEN